MAASPVLRRAVSARHVWMRITGRASLDLDHLHRYRQTSEYTTLPPSQPQRDPAGPLQRSTPKYPSFRRVFKATAMAAPAQAQDAAPLVWIDCEMTGLDPDKEEIIEIFCLVTDSNLNPLDENGWGTVVHQPESRMNQMAEWCVRTHGQSGLTAQVIASSVTPEQAADGLLAYVKKYAPKARTALLAGNSVHADRSFLVKGPYRKVVEHLHYRILDVSSIKEATYRWCPGIMAKAPRKKTLHKAKDDILESIEEARYYKEAIFQAGGRASPVR